jgi:Galactose-3-O-sulfotransferase
MRCTVYLHIPKTGGVTLRAALRHKYPATTLELHSPSDLEPLALLPLEERRAASVVTGHLPYGVHRYIPQESDYITILRDPVARVISTYHHVLRHPNHWFHDEVARSGMRLEEFVRASNGPADNLQTRLISGRGSGRLVSHGSGRPERTGVGAEALEEAKRNLDHFLVVGLTERFDESFLLIRRALGWKLPMYATRNAANGYVNPPSAEAIRLIRQRDRLDVELYEHARGLFSAAVGREGPSLRRELAAFKVLNRIPNAVGPRIPAPLRHPVRAVLSR